MEKEALTYYGEYLGGHSMYANKRDVSITLYPNEVAIGPLQLHIRYSSIRRVKNVNESNMKALRVIAFGLVGALWKKKETYLCIVYNDGIQEQTPVFKISNLEEAQRDIYQHVIESRKTPPTPSPSP